MRRINCTGQEIEYTTKLRVVMLIVNTDVLSVKPRKQHQRDKENVVMFATLSDGSMLNVYQIKRISPPRESHDVLVETSDGKIFRVTKEDLDNIKSVSNWIIRPLPHGATG
jgi:hypothetical protein